MNRKHRVSPREVSWNVVLWLLRAGGTRVGVQTVESESQGCDARFPLPFVRKEHPGNPECFRSSLGRMWVVFIPLCLPEPSIYFFVIIGFFFDIKSHGAQVGLHLPSASITSVQPCTSRTAKVHLHEICLSHTSEF